MGARRGSTRDQGFHEMLRAGLGRGRTGRGPGVRPRARAAGPGITPRG